MNVHGAVPRRTLFRALFSILYRSHIISLFEQAVEVLHILVTNVSRYGLQPSGWVSFEEHSCLLHAFFPYNLLEGHAGLFLNVFGQIRLGEMEGIYQHIQCYIHVVLLDETDDLHDPLFSAGGNMLFCCQLIHRGHQCGDRTLDNIFIYADAQ